MALEVNYSSEAHQLSTGEHSQGNSSRRQLHYLNEGGANFVFKILSCNPAEPNNDLPPQLKGKLLRISKDHSHVQSAAAQLEQFNKHFRPLFPAENIVQLNLINLSPALPKDLNALLQKLPRAANRKDDFIRENEPYALLVTDMSAQSSTPKDSSSRGNAEKEAAISLELKPKWLAPSPSAPKEGSAKRCRTCALRAQRASERVRTATDKQEMCPLALVSEDVNVRRDAARRLTGDERLQRVLTEGKGYEVLCLLRKWQLELDGKGVVALDTSVDGEKGQGVEAGQGAVVDDVVLDLCKAMTLRDCTLFVVERMPGVFEARLADLDLKLPERLPKWKGIEEELIRGGWYANAEEAGLWTEERVCLLSRAASRSD